AALKSQHCGNRSSVRRIGIDETLSHLLLEVDCNAIADRWKFEFRQHEPVLLAGALQRHSEHCEPSPDGLGLAVRQLCIREILPILLVNLIAWLFAKELGKAGELCDVLLSKRAAFTTLLSVVRCRGSEPWHNGPSYGRRGTIQQGVLYLGNSTT